MGCGESKFFQNIGLLFDNRPFVVQRRSIDLEFVGTIDPSRPMPVVFQPSHPVEGGMVTDVTLVTCDLPLDATIQMVHDSTRLVTDQSVMVRETDLRNISICVTSKTESEFKIVLRVVYF